MTTLSKFVFLFLFSPCRHPSLSIGHTVSFGERLSKGGEAELGNVTDMTEVKCRRKCNIILNCDNSTPEFILLC